MSVRRPALVFAVLAASVGLSAPAGAQEADGRSAKARIAERLEDFALSMSVRLALAADPRTLPFELDVSARGGVVHIEGDVPQDDRRTVAVVALGVAGVRAVRRVDARPAPPPATGGAGPGEGPPLVRASFHVVERGDTLFALAERYGTTVGEIVRLNGLASTTIVAGRRLRVR